MFAGHKAPRGGGGIKTSRVTRAKKGAEGPGRGVVWLGGDRYEDVGPLVGDEGEGDAGALAAGEGAHGHVLEVGHRPVLAAPRDPKAREVALHLRGMVVPGGRRLNRRRLAEPHSVQQGSQ